MTLYLKYRPQRLDELDSTQVRESLTKIIQSKQIPHALLFAGPKGSGKTSAARILAKVINCEGKTKTKPCNRCRQCLAITQGNNLDVIELDAASHRGIDDVRALRDKVALAPSQAGKKIYIVDEAHMLTTEAANAFLKTLEEPPEHVMFILATTDPQKLPATVRSRLTNIVFQKAQVEEIQRQLSRVAKGEKAKIDPEAMSLIAKAADGSFRDAIKIFEELSLKKRKIGEKDVQEWLTLGKIIQTEKLLSCLENYQVTEALKEVERVVANGIPLKTYTDDLIEKTREKMIQEQTPNLVQLIELLIDARAQVLLSPVPQLPLEVAIIKYCQDGNQNQKVEAKKGQDQEKKEKPQEKKLVVPALPQKKIPKISKKKDLQNWSEILKHARNRDTRIEALLRAARPLGYDGSTLELGVFYQFHKERLETRGIRQVLEEIVTSIYGAPIKINCVLTQRETELAAEPKVAVSNLTESEDTDIIQAAKEIFEN